MNIASKSSSSSEGTAKLDGFEPDGDIGDNSSAVSSDILGLGRGRGRVAVDMVAVDFKGVLSIHRRVARLFFAGGPWEIWLAIAQAVQNSQF